MKTKLIVAAFAALGVTAAYAGEHMMKADADGDGLVTLAEFEAAHKARVAEHFARLDENGDGVLSADEMQRPPRGDRDKLGRGKYDERMNAEKALQRLDQDGSGGVTFDELQGKHFSPDSNAFAAADADGNGELNAAELKAMMKAQRAERRKADSDTDG